LTYARNQKAVRFPAIVFTFVIVLIFLRGGMPAGKYV
jgi:hypothetical protein